MKKRILSILLALVLCLSLLPTTALADTGSTTTSTTISTFDQLKEAFSNGGDYTLDADITVTEGLTLASGKTLTINGNGHTLQPTVTGLNEQGLVNTDASVITNMITNEGTLTLQNCTVYGGKGRCIWNKNDAVLTMEKVSLERAHLTTNAEYGAGLYNTGNAILKDCSIRRNGCDNAGGGFYSKGTLIMENCALVENRNFGSGTGGGAGENRGSLYMNNCTVANNQSSEIGGGINNYCGTAYIMNSTFTGNVTTVTAANCGGGIGNNQGAVYAVNSIFAFNYANGESSDIGIYNSESTNVYLYYCAYGEIKVYSRGSSDSITKDSCKVLPSTDTVDSLFNGARTSGIVDKDGNEGTTSTYARPVITEAEGTYGVYLASSSALKGDSCGAVKTYWEVDANSFTVKMSYGNTDNTVNTALDSLTAASNEVKRPNSNSTNDQFGAVPASISVTTMYTVKVNPATGGTVTGGSAQGNSYPENTSNIKITAVPDGGYTFSHWLVGTSTDTSNTNKTYTIATLTSDVTLTPVFTPGTTHTHTPSTTWTSDNNSHWHTCTDDSCTDSAVQLDKAAHTYDQETVKAEALKSAATCTEAAKYYKSCTCGAVSTNEADVFTSGTANGHTPGSEWKYDSTNHWHICTVTGCGAVIDSTKTAHTAGDWEVKTPATAANNGVKVKKCTACGYEMETAMIPKIVASKPAHDVDVKSGLNGSASANHDEAREGTVVTVTVDPAIGYALDELTVTDKNGNAISVTSLGGGKYSFIMPDGDVTVRATFTDGTSTGFVDVPVNKYFYDAVNWAVANGITSGVDATHFAPYASCTRGQLVTFLWRAAGQPAAKATENAFSDVKESSSFYKAILWAAENGIVTGYSDGTFKPNAAVSRQQTAAILYRYAKYAKMDVSVGEDTNILSFNDAFSVSEYAVSAFQWAVGEGVITGNKGNLLPYDTCTRAQIVTMLYRLLAK